MGYKIIYILSPSHSGSTIIEMALGSDPEVFSMGELAFYNHAVNKIPHIKIGYVDGFTCTCGKQVSKCPVWSSVKKRTETKNPIIKKRCLIDNLFILLNTLNPLEKFFRLPVKIGYNKEVLDNVFCIAKKNKNRLKYLIDSSKDPRRLYELIMDKDINKKDLYVLFLVRDGRAYVNSYKKEVEKNPDMNSRLTIVSVFEWVLIHLMSRRVLNKYKVNYKEVKYHEFCKNPQLVFDDMSNFLLLKKRKTENMIKDINKQTFHNLQGNPVKFKKATGIFHDESWKQEMGALKKMILTLIFMPFNHFWVYQKHS